MEGKNKFWISAFLPVILLGVLLLVFVNYGPLGVFRADLPPIEKLFVQKAFLEPEQITLDVFNDGPEPVTVAQVSVNEVFWQFSMEPGNTLNPLESAKIKLHYPWLEGDPYGITIFASDGVTFEHEIGVATLTPKFSFLYFKSFVLLGLYVGVIPVLLGLLWFPFLKKLKANWYSFLLALTIGLLVFLGFDALSESLELVEMLPDALNGTAVTVIGFLLAVMVLSAVSYKTEIQAEKKGERYRALVWGYLIALGIGLHNMGEGLAIGSAYSIGEIALGGTLVIGFMIHNITEGVAIVAPLTRITEKARYIIPHLILMGLLAGGPTIIGTLLGGFSYVPVWNVFFLAVGSGAIFDVVFDILHRMSHGNWKSIFTITNVLGFLAGLAIMYITGFLVF